MKENCMFRKHGDSDIPYGVRVNFQNYEPDLFPISTMKLLEKNNKIFEYVININS